MFTENKLSLDRHGKAPVVEFTIEAEKAASPCPITVGIGASTGGQEALEQLFTAMPSDCGLSFVVIMHLPSDSPPFLAEMLGRYTTMKVVTAEEGMPLAPNRIYVLPPGQAMTISNGQLRLKEAGVVERYNPIDCFFCSLAAEAGRLGIAIILSGAGTDGSKGVKLVKDSGGVVIVQEPDSAINPAMPMSVIATGAADMVLPAEKIPAQIAEIARNTCLLSSHTCREATLDEDLHTIFNIVKARTGHDFSSYKSNTIMRRIERRMMVNDISGLGKYISLLRKNAQEAQALCQDILIGVTSFFRDPAAFAILAEKILPRLLEKREPDEPLRIWHACCASGEEVYSMAILIREFLNEHRLNIKVLIFATDIDEVAIAQARAGLYSDDIAADMGEERLKTFFTKTNSHWQVTKQLREMIVFAHHSLVKDPPFSRLDLLVCRNFLIYLNPDMQKRLISLFHQVLKPQGVLFLGSSETVGHQSDLFSPIDKKWKIFERMESERRNETLFPFTAPVRRPLGARRLAQPAAAGEPAPGAAAEKLLIERYCPPCVVVNDKYEVVHVSTRANRFLEVPVGGPTTDILKMARESLRPALRAAIYKAFADQKQVVFRGAKIDDDMEQSTEINVVVEPIDSQPSAGRLAMVIFEQVTAPVAFSARSTSENSLSGDEASRELLIRQLEEQLRITHEQLQATSEQLESSNEGFISVNEELMSINEEFQSANEELQSSNEELETSKEELQALNEELVTLNAELQDKVEELNQANNDIENLLTSSEIATLFLNRQFTIKRFTPAMAKIFNLIPADIGRPFRHLAGAIDWPGLNDDMQLVLERCVSIGREITFKGDGHCYIMRILPYRATDDSIEGIVVTLIDITERKRAEEAHARLAALVESSDDAIIARDLNGIIFSWNSGSESLFGYGADEIIGKPITMLLPPERLEEEEHIMRSLATDERIEHFKTVRLAKDGRRINVSVTASPIIDTQGRIIGVSKIARDITKHMQAEEALRRAKEEWERTFASVPDLITILDNQHRVLRVNEAMARRLGLKPEECVGLPCYEAIHGTSLPPLFCPHSRTLEDGCRHIAELHVDRFDGDFIVTTTPLLDEKGERIGSVHVAHDITERKRMEDALRELNEELEVRVSERTAELADTIEYLQFEVSERLSAEEKLLRLNRLHAMLSETNQAIVRTKDRNTLFNDFCRIAVEHGNFKLAWIGLVDEKSDKLEIAAAKGETGYLDDIRITTNSELEGLGPTGISIREGTDCVCNDFLGSPLTHPWHERGRAHNIRSSASIALKQEEQVVGALTLYTDQKDFFDQQQVELFRRMGADISFALGNIARETRRWEAEQALREETAERLRAVEALREKEQLLIQQSRQAAMGEMIGNIAHQWRQPLNTLGLTVQGLLLFYDLDEFNREFLEKGVGTSMELIQHMSRTIDDFRNYFRPDKEKSTFKVAEAIENTLSLIEDSFKNQHIDFEVIAKDDPAIYGYRNEFAQALLNILNNARDALTERNIDAPKVTITIGTENNKAVVTVADNAGGIDKEIMGKIFDPYFTTKGPQSGTGVGLFMSKAIIEKNMGGRLVAHNTANGAEFRIEV